MVTEREKMLSGLLYDPSDRELTDLRQRAFQLVERFNRLQKEDAAAQREILEALLGGGAVRLRLQHLCRGQLLL